MRTDFRALCTELVHLNDHPDTDHAKWSEAIDRVRAALAAEPQGEEPTDEEVIQWTNDCAEATRESEAEHYWAFETPSDYICAIARAALARWGRPAQPPEPPAEGEVAKLVAALRSRDRWMQLTDNQVDRAADLLEHALPLPTATETTDD